MRVILAIIAFMIGAGVAAVFAGTTRWARATQASVDALTGTVGTAAPRVLFLHESTDGLPPPVARYFRTALKDGQPIVRSAIATQQAEFFLNGAWRPLKATQHFTTAPPGFVWDARIAMAPMVEAYVRDSYVGGIGTMTASAIGLYPIVDQTATTPLNSGALHRFLGESIWIPTALLPSANVSWTARDDRSAMVTLRDGGNSVSLLFTFNAEGLIASISGDRFKEDGGAYSLQPWRIACGDYQVRDGMTIPLYAEVAWVSGGAAEPYWRGRITSITYRYN